MKMNKRVLTKAKISEVIDRLATVYKGDGTALLHHNTWELLIATVLSAQTTDISVNKVTPELFLRWPNAESLALADTAEVESVIRTIGLYRTKSTNIVRLSKKLIDDFGGVVPDNMDDLTALPGVGRKTANVVLAFGFGQERMPVDTHVFRVANRIGLCAESSPEKTELALIKRIPEGRLSESHHFLIWHGRRVCHARGPTCDSCNISDLCLYPDKQY